MRPESIWQGLLRIASDPSVLPRTKVEAWSAIRGWADRKARLLGLDAPSRSRVEVITEDMIDAEIERLTAEIAKHDQDAGGAPAA